MAALADLERIRAEYGGGAGARKRALLDELEGRRLTSARAVLRLHETLCFLRAYPDDAALLARVERMLDRFLERPDLRRFRKSLDDTGIAGTAIHYPFYPDTALWLAERWPGHLRIDWPAFERDRRDALDDTLDYLVSWTETAGLDGEDFSCRRWVERLAGGNETDAEFILRRFFAMRADDLLRLGLVDSLGIPYRLRRGPDTPSRTTACAPGMSVSLQHGPLDRARPDLRKELRTPPRSVRSVSAKRGRALIDLARSSMVTRSRDLDAFRFGDPRDVRLVDCGDGLCFVAIGVRPEHRHVLEAVYAFLTLKNGVPVGYVLNSALFGSAEIAFNIFETFRGGEAGRIYGRTLATVRYLFGVDSFVIYPYQLGDRNAEALGSGAWWFYRKLGFRPRHPDAVALMESELKQMRERRGHRSSVATLRKLAKHNMYFHMGRKRDDVIGELRLGRVGLRAIDMLAERFGSDRERGERTCAKEAARRFGVRSTARWSEGERLAWRRWGPILTLLPRVEDWTAAERRDAVLAVRAKGGRREADFVARFDGHAKLRAAVKALTTERGLRTK